MSKQDKYTDPQLRAEVKEEIQQGDKGGAPGQWSARKAQMMASEYKKRGGEYTTDKDHKDESAKHLDNWTKEEWQTKEGSGNAKQADGTEKRYLPKEAWEKMSEQEKQETDEKKLQASKEGRQYVGNTTEAKNARKDSAKDLPEEPTECATHWEDTIEAGAKQYQEFKKKEDSGNDESEVNEQEDDQGNEPNTKKRGRGANQIEPTKKQQKTKSKNDNDGPNGSAGDKTRVPQLGQHVQWRSIQGYTEGDVVEVVYEEKSVDGKSIKASKEDPRVVLKSASSGKIVVHKPEVIYF